MGASTGTARSQQQGRRRLLTNWRALPGPYCPAAETTNISRCGNWRRHDGRGKDAALGKHKALPTFPRHDDGYS